MHAFPQRSILSRNWPLIGAVLLALAAAGAIVAHRIHKADERQRLEQVEAAEVPPEAPEKPEEPEVALVEPQARSGAATATAKEAAKRPGPPKDQPLKLPDRFRPAARSPRYALYAAAGKRAERFPEGPSVPVRWFEGADGHRRAVREMRDESADMLVYFYTDW